MLLFVLCGIYCEYFARIIYNNLDELNYDKKHQKQKSFHVIGSFESTNFDNINMSIDICWNNKTTDVLTEPGYLCSQIVLSSMVCSINYTKIYINTGVRYCCDYQYMPHSTNSSSTSQDPASTPKITQEPCQRLRIRVVYTLVHTIIE